MRIERQFTIDELAERLALSRSTVYYWVRDLPIPGSGSGGEWPEAARRKGTRAMQRKYRLLREGAYQEGLGSFDELTADPTFRDFVCLYIAEGYKRTRHSVSICNSDPAVMQIATRWIGRLTERTPEFSIQYHADQDLNELREFWGDTLGINSGTIKLLRKSNSNQMTGR
jgi:excisionase family DNA binding protein